MLSARPPAVVVFEGLPYEVSGEPVARIRTKTKRLICRYLRQHEGSM